MTKEDCDIIKVAKWECPTETGIPLITMPNIPKPLHGLPPRKIMGTTKWDAMRKRCYFDADYKCEICGCSPSKGNLHAHELYEIDYLSGESLFKRCIAICREDHDFIHSGRLITLYKEGNPLYPKSYVLRVLEKGFSLINSYNEKSEEKLRVFDTIVEFLKVPELEQEVSALIKKYDIKFYRAPKRGAKWSDWRLVWNGKEYFTPYAGHEEWKEAMQKASKTDTMRAMNYSAFKGGVFDEIAKIIGNND